MAYDEFLDYLEERLRDAESKLEDLIRLKKFLRRAKQDTSGVDRALNSVLPQYMAWATALKQEKPEFEIPTLIAQYLEEEAKKREVRKQRREKRRLK